MLIIFHFDCLNGLQSINLKLIYLIVQLGKWGARMEEKDKTVNPEDQEASSAEDKRADERMRLVRMSRENMLQAVFVLAGPVILELLLASSVGIADTAMVGRFGPVAIAAVGLSNQLVMFLTTVFAAIRTGTTVLVAHFTGQGNHRMAEKSAEQALLLGLILSLLLASFLLMFPALGYYLLGAEEEVIVEGLDYMRWRALGLIFSIMTMTVTAVLRGIGNTKTPLYINTISSVANIFFNYLFIFGNWGMPRMGTSGAGFATMLSQVVGAVIIFYMTETDRFPLKFSLRKMEPFDKDIVGRMLKIGIPAGIETLLLRGAMMSFTRIVSGLGTDMYAAHQIGMRLDSIAVMPGFGFATAATTLVGQNMGAKQWKEAKKAGNLTILLGVIFMTVMATIIYFFARLMATIFTDVEHVIEAAVGVVRIMALVLPFMGIARISAGALRGAGDTQFVMVVTGVLVWVVRVGVAYVLVNHFNMGLVGAWLGTSADHVVTAVVMIIRWIRGKWMDIRI